MPLLQKFVSIDSHHW